MKEEKIHDLDHPLTPLVLPPYLLQEFGMDPPYVCQTQRSCLVVVTLFGYRIEGFRPLAEFAHYVLSHSQLEYRALTITIG